MSAMFAKSLRALLAAAAVVASLAAAPAGAVVVGTVGGTPYFSQGPVAPGPMSIDFFFDLAAGFEEVSLSANQLELRLPGVPVPLYEIDDFTLTLFGPGDVLIATTNTFTSGGFLELLSDLMPGVDYRANLTGDAIGSAGGLYSFAIVASPEVIPEPGTIALLLAGIVMLGAVTRRRMRAG